MRALAMLMLVATAARAEPPRTTPIGFDHTLHERDVVVAGADAVPCAHCHELRRGRLVGRPAHAACFGACHGAPPAPPARGAKLALAADRLALCTNCHAEALLVAPYTGRMPVTYPPYTIDRDFNLELGHKQHAQVACTQCHDLGERAPPPAPHARCAGCHDGSGAAGKGPPMTACAGCHPPAGGRPQPPELAALQDTVSAIFSHARHAARGGAGRDCATCHAAIAATDASELPRPTAAECARCHDGTHAFATTVACTRCHAAPAGAFEVARPEARFSHAGPHAQLVASRPCAACHGLAKDGDATMPGHAACTGCHADDFGARHPTKCGACHIATEPWRHLRADRPPPDATELGATLDHGKHPGACTGCHALRTATTELRMPRGHAACTGTACHAASGGPSEGGPTAPGNDPSLLRGGQVGDPSRSGPAPQLGDCTACHALGRTAARDARRAADPWSVRAAFVHATHATDRAGAPLACTACHDDVTAPDVVQLAAPPKRTCAPCHDGTTAFSLTGITCKRCHTR